MIFIRIQNEMSTVYAEQKRIEQTWRDRISKNVIFETERMRWIDYPTKWTRLTSVVPYIYILRIVIKESFSRLLLHVQDVSLNIIISSVFFYSFSSLFNCVFVLCIVKNCCHFIWFSLFSILVYISVLYIIFYIQFHLWFLLRYEFKIVKFKILYYLLSNSKLCIRVFS